MATKLHDMDVLRMYSTVRVPDQRSDADTHTHTHESWNWIEITRNTNSRCSEKWKLLLQFADYFLLLECPLTFTEQTHDTYVQGIPHQSHRKSSTSPGPTVYSVVLLPTSRYISYRQEIDFNIYFVRILTKVYYIVHRKWGFPTPSIPFWLSPLLVVSLQHHVQAIWHHQTTKW